jgi:predicted permease
MDSLWKDIRFGLRGLRKRPLFAIVAVVTLSLGIGANTAIFTLVNAVILKKLPVRNPDELVFFSDDVGEGTSEGDPASGEWHLFSSPVFRHFRDHDQSFQELAAFRSGEARISVRAANSTGQAMRASGHLVSGNFFNVFGVGAIQGRVLTNEDDSTSARPVTVISYGCWETQWNKDPQIVGKEISLNETRFTIVGVMPKEFFGERVRRSADYWMPLAFQPEIELQEAADKREDVYWLNIIGRLKPGVSIEQAQAAATVELQQFLTAQVGSQINDEARDRIKKSYIGMASAARGLSGLRYFYSDALKMLMAIVVVVLLIACANVGNLLLSRGAARQQEMALRQALGASRGRLVRQLLVESLLLSLIGGVFGVLLAQWAVSLLVGQLAKTAPLNVRPDLLVLGFTFLLSVLAGLLFGIAPAIRASGTGLSLALKEKVAQRRRGRFGLGLGPALVISQVALSLVLLVGAGLFARSLLKLQQVDLGFNRDNVLVFGVDTRLAGYKVTQLSTLYRQLFDRLSSLPNVRYVTIATYSPMSGSRRASTVTIRGRAEVPGENTTVSDMLIGPNYAETLSLPLLMGRGINLQDTPSSNKVAVVNQAFVDKFFPGQNPLGRRISFDEKNDKNDLEVVGVLGNIKYANAKSAADPAVYRPILQVEEQGAFSNSIQIRTEGEPLNLGPAVRAAVAQIDGKLTIGNLTSLQVLTDETMRQEKLIAQLVSFFGLLALALAAVGLYGIMAHAVVRRTQEIGIRMALGAERRSIVWMVLRDSLVLVLLGVVIGVPVSMAAAKLISTQLFGLTGSDPLSVLIAVGVLSLVALIAGYLPARRASRLDPLAALRYE